MRRFHYATVAAVAAVGFASVASAADLPTKAPVVVDPAPIFTWSGFYVGANVGGSWGRMSTDFSLAGVPIGSTSQNMNGWLGGIQTGYNWQRGAWVFGLEADIQATSQKATSSAAGATPGTPAIPCIEFDPPAPACIPGTGISAVPGVPGSVSYEQKLPWFATFRGRLGVTVAPTWLLYATGGLAVGEIKTNASFTIPTAAIATGFSDTKAGWTVGAGVEWGFSPNWSAKVEYLYIDFGHINNSFSSLAPFTGNFTANSHVTDNIVRVGVNYRFN
jgi:outer membrane immunogenic protein